MPTTGEPSAEERVSVVVPVRDCERYLGEAIASLLAQSPPPFEVIVVDDGSTDGSAAVAEAFGPPVRVMRQEPLGTAAAVNHGVSLGRGPLLAFVDADDTWQPGKLALQLEALRRQPDLDAVLGHVLNVGGTWRAGEPLPGYARGTLLIRRAAFDRVGGFTDWRLSEFIEWYARAADAGLRALMLPDVVLHRRIHGENTGARRRDERDEYARVVKAILDRRRRERLSPP